VRPTLRTRTGALAALVCGGLLLLAPGARADDPVAGRMAAFERSIDAAPEDLELAAQYRAVATESARYDRAIGFLERIARRTGSGPNAYINLALAYVDKVPPSGDLRRLYLGRDAMGALTKSIALRPSVFAYYMRGVINLYYNRFILTAPTRASPISRRRWRSRRRTRSPRCWHASGRRSATGTTSSGTR